MLCFTLRLRGLLEDYDQRCYFYVATEWLVGKLRPALLFLLRDREAYWEIIARVVMYTLRLSCLLGDYSQCCFYFSRLVQCYVSWLSVRLVYFTSEGNQFVNFLSMKRIVVGTNWSHSVSVPPTMKASMSSR